jgi:hypothetical protein
VLALRLAYEMPYRAVAVSQAASSVAVSTA